MPNSKYLEAFRQVKETLSDKYQLIGDCILVEEIPEEEIKTQSGIIMSSGGKRQLDGLEMNKPLFVRVLAVGSGYYDEESDKDVPLEVQPGDIILVGRMGVNFFSTFGSAIISERGSQIGLSRESEIRMRFIGEDGYAAVCSLIASATKPKE